MKKALAILICMLTLVTPVLASGEASNGPMPNMAGGSDAAAYKITDDGIEVDESLLTVEKAANAVISAEEISGAAFYSTDNAAGVINFAGTGALTIGGEEENITVTYALGGND